MFYGRHGFIKLAHITFIALIGLGWGLSVPASSAYDDAYITYRYAVNLAQGHGFVYNPGEWVLGVTTPLYALLLTPAGVLGLPAVVIVSHWIGVACWIVTAWLAGALLHQTGSIIGATVASLLVIVQPILLSSLGMETTVVTALMLLSAWSWLGRHTKLAAMSSAALLIARQDAALWLLYLGIGVWVTRSIAERFTASYSNLEYTGKNNRHPFDHWIAAMPWREGVGSLLLTIPWFSFSFWRYGGLLPNSATAKIGQRSAMHVTGEQPFLTGFLSAIHGVDSPWIVAGLFALASLGIVAITLRARRFWWLPLWLITYFIIYVALGVVNFPWYYAPPLVSICLLSGIGTAWLAGELAPSQVCRAETRRPSYTRSLAAIAFGVAAVAAVLPVTNDTIRSRNTYSLTGKPAAYTATAHWLAEHSPPETTVATIEIGIVGFWSQRRVLDTMGLVSPAMSHHLTGWTDSLVYAITRYWPDYTLTLPNTAWDPLIVQPWFQASYRPAVILGSPPVTLYERMRNPPAPVLLPMPLSFGNQLVLSAFVFECGTNSADNPGSTELSGDRCKFHAPLTGWLDLAATRPLTANHQLTLALVDAATLQRYSVTHLWPYGHYNLYPTSHWPIQEILRVPFMVALGAGESLPSGTYRLGLTLYDEGAGETLLLDTPAHDASGGDLTLLGWLRIGDPPIPAVALVDTKQYTPATEWADGLLLNKVTLPTTLVSDTLPMQLAWHVEQTPNRDLTLFLHLLDTSGNIVAQLDRKPFAGRFPTPVWRPGETLVEQVDIPLPSPLQPGRYALRLGWYDEAGRSPLVAGDDSMLLEEAITVR
jgi:hypothetical protein